MSTQTDPYTINTTGGVTQDDIRVARDAADLDATATAAPDLTQLREAVEDYRKRRAEYDRTEDGDFSAAAEDIALTAFMGATWNIVNAADALFPEDGTP